MSTGWGRRSTLSSLSLILLIGGWASIYMRVSKHPGVMYGIDFRGGTLVYVRFAGPPPIDQIRKGLQQAGLANSTIQGISDTQAVGSQNDVVIGLEQNARATNPSTPASRKFSTFCTHFGDGILRQARFQLHHPFGSCRRPHAERSSRDQFECRRPLQSARQPAGHRRATRITAESSPVSTS